VEALNLSVGLRPVGLGAQVLDLTNGEEFSQRAVVDVGERVVGHQALGADAVALKPSQSALHECGDGRGALIGVQLDVGQAGVVVDDRVREVVANAGPIGHPAAAAL
jgi:hypothetical protein